MPLNIIAEKSPRQLALDAHWAATLAWRLANRRVLKAEAKVAELIAAERVAFEEMNNAAGRAAAGVMA